MGQIKNIKLHIVTDIKKLRTIQIAMLAVEDLNAEDDNEAFVGDIVAQTKCRETRPLHWVDEWGRVKQNLSYVVRFFFWSSGYNRPVHGTSKIYTGIILLICWYQVVYILARTFDCPNFNCSSNSTKVIDSTLRMEYATYSASAVGSALSYTFMVSSLMNIYSSKCNGISPYVGLKDMSNSKAKVILAAFIISIIVFISYVCMYVYIIYSQFFSFSKMPLYIISETCDFIAQWVGTVSIYTFACSSFAIGSFASDTLRRIHLCTGNFDSIVRIHKELRLIVGDTTSSYAVWFLLHWLTYGIVVVCGFVVIALYKFGQDDFLTKMYFGTFFGLHVFHFILPCVCGAYVTTVCANIISKVNNTTSDDWCEGHLFKNRKELNMFVAYCMVSPICFKIGRITFSSTLAWCSFIFGSFGLLFHFFT